MEIVKRQSFMTDDFDDIVVQMGGNVVGRSSTIATHMRAGSPGDEHIVNTNVALVNRGQVGRRRRNEKYHI